MKHLRTVGFVPALTQGRELSRARKDAHKLQGAGEAKAGLHSASTPRRRLSSTRRCSGTLTSTVPAAGGSSFCLITTQSRLTRREPPTRSLTLTHVADPAHAFLLGDHPGQPSLSAGL